MTGEDERKGAPNLLATEMQPKLNVLNLLLGDAGVNPVIQTVDDRKRVQKAVYLAQRAGADLGYRYGWYKLGPYSPALTRDYYDLADALASGETAEGALRPEVRKILARVRPLFNVPKGVELSQEDWLELLASADYLRVVKGYDDRQLDETIREKKVKLHPHLAVAMRSLEAFGLG